MKHLLILLFTLLTLLPCQAAQIDLKVENTSHHGGARMPIAVSVTAIYDSHIVNINIKNYTGQYAVNIIDEYGNIVKSTLQVSVKGSDNIEIPFEGVESKSYLLQIYIGGIVYSGYFRC